MATLNVTAYCPKAGQMLVSLPVLRGQAVWEALNITYFSSCIHAVMTKPPYSLD